MSIRTGACRCEKVGFSVEGDSSFFSVLCHCGPCRLGTSAPFSFVIGVLKENFKWTRGEELVQQYDFTDTFRGFFCKECGMYLIQGPINHPFYGILFSFSSLIFVAFVVTKIVLQ